MNAARRMGVPYNTIPLKGARAEGVSLCRLATPHKREEYGSNYVPFKLPHHQKLVD